MAHCGWWTLTVLMAVTLISSFSGVTGVTLNIPSQIDIGGQNSGNNRMTVSCSHTGAGVVLSTEIGKLDQNNVKRAIVQILATNTDNVVVADSSLQQRMTQISGSTSSGNLQYTLSQLVCTDAGRYYCSVTFNDGGFQTEEDLKNVTARNQPLLTSICAAFGVRMGVMLLCGGLMISLIIDLIQRTRVAKDDEYETPHGLPGRSVELPTTYNELNTRQHSILLLWSNLCEFMCLFEMIIRFGTSYTVKRKY